MGDDKDFRVVGPLEVEQGGQLLRLQGSRQRRLLDGVGRARRAHDTVRVDALTDALVEWRGPLQSSRSATGWRSPPSERPRPTSRCRSGGQTYSLSMKAPTALASSTTNPKPGPVSRWAVERIVTSLFSIPPGI